MIYRSGKKIRIIIVIDSDLRHVLRSSSLPTGNSKILTNFIILGNKIQFINKSLAKKISFNKNKQSGKLGIQ